MGMRLACLARDVILMNSFMAYYYNTHWSGKKKLCWSRYFLDASDLVLVYLRFSILFCFIIFYLYFYVAFIYY